MSVEQETISALRLLVDEQAIESAQSRDRLLALHLALQKFGRHADDCGVHHYVLRESSDDFGRSCIERVPRPQPCNCGLVAALKAGR